VVLMASAATFHYGVGVLAARHARNNPHRPLWVGPLLLWVQCAGAAGLCALMWQPSGAAAREKQRA